MNGNANHEYSAVAKKAAPLFPYYPRTVKKVAKFMDSGIVQTFLMLLLMLSLFLTDSWTVGNSPDSTNDALYGLLTAIFILFMCETITLTIVQDKYFMSFYFYMDLIGNLSILLDIGWISNSFLPSGSGHSRGSILRATRAAKLGARYGRLMRLLKLMRLVRLLPCFAKDGEDELQEPEPTMSAVRKVSRELISMLSLRIAMLTMLLVIVVPFLAYSPVDQGPAAFLASVNQVVKMRAEGSNISVADIDQLANNFHHFYQVHDQKVMEIIVRTPYWEQLNYSYPTRKTIREANTVLYTRESDHEGVGHVYLSVNMDQTIPNQQSSSYGIGIMVLVIWVLVFFSSSFTSAVENLVVMPLNKMMTILRESASIMLRSMKAMEDAEESKNGEKGPKSDTDSDLEEELETAMLEKMVEKLARIMKHVLPGANELNIAQGADAATATWLTSNFSTAAGTHSIGVIKIDEEAERVRLLELAASQTVVSNEKLNSWYFDTLEYSHEQLNEIVCYIFSIFNFFDEFGVSMIIFRDFLAEMSVRYIENTYHNYKHGVDVLHTVYRLVMVPHLNLAFSTLEVFSILIAALAHDVGHPGVNNLYLVKSRSELALRHNDRSPLENMHCSVLYEVLGKEKTNILSGVKDQQWKDIRKIILTSILGTDMSHHFEQISKTQVFAEVNGEDTKKFCRGEKETIDCFREDNNRLFVLELLLHSADISNPYKPYDICYKWCLLVVEEFSLQGDREKSENLEISPMCDRNAIVLSNMQMGFIEFVVTPLISALINVFPPLFEIGQNMTANFINWGDRRKQEITNDEAMAAETKPVEVQKVTDRLNKYREKMAFLDAYQSMPRRESGHAGMDATSSTAPRMVRRASIRPTGT